MSAPSNGVKNGFFGYIKGLFRKDNEVVTAADYDTTEVATLPLAPPQVEVAHAAPAPVAAAPAPTRNDNLDSREAGVAPSVEVPLQPILDGLNNELLSRVRVKNVGDTTVNIPFDKILSQLAQGQVRVPFGDVRKGAPHVFSPETDFDRISVSIPLGEVLSRINPALLVRRTASRIVEVPEDIASPFAGRGEGLSLTVGNAKTEQPAAPKKAAPAPVVNGRGSIPARPAQQPPAPQAPVSFAPLKQRTQSPVPTATDVPNQFFAAPKSAPAPATQPQPPAFASRPALQPAPVIQFQPQAVSAPKAVAATATAPAITVPLSTLSETWPQAVRLEIVQTNLAQSQVGLPVDAIETALKRGRVAFTWKTLRSWIRPATPGMVSAHDAVELELPLKVIAPLFLARKQSNSVSTSKTSVDEAIPNIFFGFPQPEAAPAPVQAAPQPTLINQSPAAPAAPMQIALSPSAPAPTAALAAASHAVAAAAVSAAAAAATVNAAANKIADTNYYLWDQASDTQMLHIESLKQKGATSTEFMKRYSSPNEIVARAASMAGVAGVLIALPDGLMVASRLAPDLNGDTLAAFLPQIFAKVGSCTKELRMGDLNNVSFTVGNTPWKIFRVNAIFFAAFGIAGQPMPTVQLAELAGELDRKNK
jgi:predicted regulator of Ras-like GTPase activity (Roadblock/LC7/MglB family)